MIFLGINEKKLVKQQKILSQAENDIVFTSAEKASDENQFKLLHINGVSSNQVDLIDPEFGVVASNSYRIERKCEMLQW